MAQRRFPEFQHPASEQSLCILELKGIGWGIDFEFEHAGAG
jgi:hypothetical protein